MVHLTIDDRPIEAVEGRSLLEACRENGIEIPTLCYHPALEPYGACRLCVVEAALPPRRPRLVAACVYPCEEGAVVRTASEMVLHSRRLTVELLLGSAGWIPELESLARSLGVREVRAALPEQNPCILCGLCVRACQEIAGISAISVIQRGMAKKVSTPFQIASSRCISCGSCVLICPTGAFKLSDVTGPRQASPGRPAYRRRYYHVGAELDLRPNFVQDLAALLGGSREKGAR